MRTKTVDEVVRESLMNFGFPIHYYLPFLHHALKCLEELNFDFDFGNVKQEKLTISAIDRITIPIAATDIISVFGLYEEKQLPFVRNTNITTIYNVKNAVNVAYDKNSNTLDKQIKGSGYAPFVGSEELATAFYPSQNLKYEYNVDLINNEIVLGNGHGLTSINVKYLTDSVSKTSSNLVYYYAIPVIHAYIEYYYSKTNGSPQSAIAVLKDNYYNQKRLLRARMNPLTKPEILNILLRT
jgi:hypothetical protein